MQVLQSLFSTNFLPHGTCYLWNPHIVWLHVISDGIIALSYYCIPFSLIYLIRKRRDIPFNWVFWMFSLFVLGCGTTHLMEVWTVWHPTYLLSGIMKATTASLSIATAVTIVPLLPKAVRLPGPAQLKTANRELQKQVAARIQREDELMRLSRELEHRIEQRTAELASMNRSLEKEITLGVETQQALRASQARLSGVIESAMDAIITVDQNQRILLFNRAAEGMLGCDARQALGQPLDRFVPERYRSAHVEHIRRFGDTGITARSMGSMGQLWAVRADGTEFPIEASISQTEAAGKKLFTVILRDITERLHHQRGQALLAAIVESSESAIFAKDLEGVVTSWNKGAERLYGYCENEMVGKHVFAIVPSALRAEEEQFRRRVALGETVRRHETVRMRSNGSVVNVSLVLSPLRDGNGTVTGVSTIAHDISELKRAEEALRQSQDRLRLFIEHAPAALAMFDRNMRYVQVSNRWKSDYGLCDVELPGTSHSEAFSVAIPARWRDVHRRVLAGEVLHAEDDHLEGADGSVHWLKWEARPWHDLSGEIGGVIIFSEDITPRKQAEAALRESHARLKKVLEVETVGVLFWDLNSGCLTDANDAFLSLMGYTREDVGAGELSWQKLTPPEYIEASRAELRKFSANGRVGPYEKEYFRKDGTRQWLLFAGSSLGENQCVEFCVDISDRKKAEEALRQSQEKYRRLNEELEQRVRERTAELESANKELEAFTYSVSHDLRAPLRHIAGFSKMLAEDSGDGLKPDSRHYLERIQDGIQHMGRLVDDLLSLTRIGRHELRMQIVGLESIVRRVIADLAPDIEGREIEWKIGNLPYVEGDSSLLEVAFHNLVSNSVKYTRPRAKTVIEIGCEEAGGEQAVFVRDNGVGFNMKYADKLFGVFQRLHRSEDFEGTGVGLATVQRVVQKHGGRIWAHAELDKGATFYLTLRSAKSAENGRNAELAAEVL